MRTSSSLRMYKRHLAGGSRWWPFCSPQCPDGVRAVWFLGDLLIRFCFDLLFQPSLSNSALMTGPVVFSFFSAKFHWLGHWLGGTTSHSPHPPAPLQTFSQPSGLGSEWPAEAADFHLLSWLIASFNLEHKKQLKDSCLCILKNLSELLSKIGIRSLESFQWEGSVF